MYWSKLDPESRKTLLWYELRLRRFLFNVWGFVLAALSFFVFLVVFLGVDREQVYRSSTPAQPLIRVIPNFLPRSLFQALQSSSPRHPFNAENELDTDNFKHTRGWVTKFNLEGLERMRQIPEMREALEYFDNVRIWESNTFVMNLLIADQPPSGEDAVGAHQDDSAAIQHNDDFLAHQVNVLYLQIPENMQGGQVELWREEADETESDPAVVYAAENLMVEFKGTAFHRVRGFHSPSGKPRISLVVEQYRLPPAFYQYTVDLCVNKECNNLEENK